MLRVLGLLYSVFFLCHIYSTICLTNYWIFLVKNIYFRSQNYYGKKCSIGSAFISSHHKGTFKTNLQSLFHEMIRIGSCDLNDKTFMWAEAKDTAQVHCGLLRKKGWYDWTYDHFKWKCQQSESGIYKACAVPVNYDLSPHVKHGTDSQKRKFKIV